MAPSATRSEPGISTATGPATSCSRTRTATEPSRAIMPSATLRAMELPAPATPAATGRRLAPGDELGREGDSVSRVDRRDAIDDPASRRSAAAVVAATRPRSLRRAATSAARWRANSFSRSSAEAAGVRAWRGGDPGRQRGGQRADRPVAAPDDAVPAEAGDRMLDVGPDVVERPGRRRRHRRRRRRPSPPRSAAARSRRSARARGVRPVLDRRHAAMVEHELHVRAERRRARSPCRSGRGGTQRSNGRPAPREPRAVRAEPRPLADVVRDDMQHAAEALDERIGERALEEGGKIRVLRPAGADRAAQQQRAVRRRAARRCASRPRCRPRRRRLPYAAPRRSPQRSASAR